MYILWIYHTLMIIVQYYQVMDAMFARARSHAATGNCAEAFIAYEDILAKEKTSTGKKIDATLEQARVAFFCLVSSLADLLTCSLSLLCFALLYGLHQSIFC